MAGTTLVHHDVTCSCTLDVQYRSVLIPLQCIISTAISRITAARNRRRRLNPMISGNSRKRPYDSTSRSTSTSTTDSSSNISSTSTSNSTDRPAGPPSCPSRSPSSITIDQQTFHADRFYLNAPTGLPYFHKCQSGQTSQQQCQCQCQCQQPPPLFDRNKLIQSLDLKAVIIGTYTLHSNYLLNELPQLFASTDSCSAAHNIDNRIPTLVLHGVKNFTAPCSSQESQSQSQSQSLSKPKETEKERIEKSEDEELRQLFQIFDANQKRKVNTIRTHIDVDIDMGQTNTTCIPAEKRKKEENQQQQQQKNKNKNKSVQIEKEVIAIVDNGSNDNVSDDDEVEFVGLKKASPKKKTKMDHSGITTVKKEIGGRSHSQLSVDVSYLAQKHGKKLFQMPCSDDVKRDDNVDGSLKLKPKNVNRDSSDARNSKSIRARGIIDQKDRASSFGEHVFFSEVEVKFLPPGKFHPRDIENNLAAHIAKKSGKSSDPDDVIVLDHSDHEDGGGNDGNGNGNGNCNDGHQGRNAFGINPSVASKRQSQQGCYHPKYLILFEKSGAIVVVVSSANMTSQKPVDGSWIQRFEPVNTNRDGDGDGNDFKEPTINELNDRCDGSDFGHVLADFMQKQSEGIREGDILPIQFLRKYIGAFETFCDFRKAWRFDLARVHLVSTVPGYFPGRFTAGHLNPLTNLGQRVLYGPQRVADILYKLSEKGSRAKKRNSDEVFDSIHTGTPKPWLPNSLLSEKDRLVLQTTSFGAKWTSQDVEGLVRQYMGHDDPNDDDSGGKSLIDYVDILWPSMNYMEDIGKSHKKTSPNDREFQHFIFLQSQGLNSSDLAICSQMKLYQNCNPAPLPMTLTPHIKTYTRLLSNKVGSEGFNPLAWTMLSSACFSRGAQGFTTKKNNSLAYDDERAYSNFELAILFVSRLQGDHATDRLYASYPAPCRCRSPKAAMHQNVNTLLEGAEVIPMPFPFDLKSRPYQPSEEPEFQETPFFNRMTKDSISSGFNSLTPFGNWCKDRFSKL